MNKKIGFLIISIITLVTSFSKSPPYRSNDISSISISDDGKVIAWDWFKDICIANTDNPQKYNRYSLEQKCKFGAKQIKLSGIGKKVTFIGDDSVYVAIIKNYNVNKINKIEIKENGKPRQLSINSIGDKILVSLKGERIPKKCSPGWENVILFSKSFFKWEPSSFIRKVDECQFVCDFQFVGDNHIIYKLRDSGNKAGYVIKTKIQKNGKWCCEHYIDVFGYRLIDINREGNLFILANNRLMNHGDSVFTIFTCILKNDNTLSKPNPILQDHKDPILWGIKLSPDSKKLVWTHLVRGEDGNEIIKREIRVIKYKDGMWSNPEILCEVPRNPQIKDITISNKNILFTTFRSYKTLDKERKKYGVKTQENKIYFYTTLNTDGKLIEIKQIK